MKHDKHQLDKSSINANNNSKISGYALKAYKKSKFDEVYTEYRAQWLLKKEGKNGFNFSTRN